MKKTIFGNNWTSKAFSYVMPKDGNYYAEIRIVYDDNTERDKAANAVHESLRGNKSYINSDIVLNVDENNVIVIIVASEDADMPGYIVDEIFDKRPTN